MIAQVVGERTTICGPSRSVFIVRTLPTGFGRVLVHFKKLTFHNMTGYESTIGFESLLTASFQLCLTFNHISAGTNYFDPLLRKLVVKGDTRGEAVLRLHQALLTCKIHGPPNNLSYLLAICENTTFNNGRATTAFLDTFEYTPRFALLIVHVVPYPDEIE